MAKAPFSPVPVCDSLSRERLSFYLSQTSTEAEALALYAFNVKLSEALYPTMQQLEVALRNRFEVVLVGAYGTNWYTHRNIHGLLGTIGQNNIADALQELGRRGKPISSSAMIAELSFGFWTTLLGLRYEIVLWRPYGHLLFPHATAHQRNIALIRNDFTRIRQLRNRIAHHEPIIKNPSQLWERYEAATKLLGWMTPEVARWLKKSRLDRFPVVFKKAFP